MPRTVPSRVFSSASPKSVPVTRSWPCWAAARAASLTRLARSAPTMPGVAAATAARSTSGASGTCRVCTRRISSRPLRSGGPPLTRRSNRPGRSRAGSRISGRLVAASTTTPSLPWNPSISVRIWLSVCSRPSPPPAQQAPPPAPPAGREGAAARPADRVELVDEDDRRRDLLGLVEQVAHPAGADADDRLDELRGGDGEERHPGLPP